MTFLHEATKDWNYLENIVLNYTDEGYVYKPDGKTYGYKGITTKDNIVSIISKSGSTTATFENLKARLPKVVEMQNQGCSTENYSCAKWVNDYYNSFLLASVGHVNFGCWERHGYIYGNGVEDPRGVRPVISVSKQYIK